MSTANRFAAHQHLLTANQLEAACHAQGHARVLAVAGAGKTRMLIARIAWLLDQGVEDKRIRVLTYNREAADDFRLRLQRGVGANQLQVQTFHALGWRILQRLMTLGIAPKWSLADAGKEAAIKRAALMHCQLDYDQIENLGQALEWAKGIAAPLDLSLSVLPESMRHLKGAVLQVEKLQQEAGVWFFTDMLYMPWKLMAQNAELRAQFANHLDYILVDEYQDVNEVQHVMLQWLAGERAQVMVVGDVDQCIYTWRGANPDFLASRYAQDFAGAVSYYLPHTFRFGHSLALLANHAIDANPWTDRKLVLATEFAKPTQIYSLSGNESKQIVKHLQEWQQAGHSLQESAVLVRLWSQAAAIELALLQAGISYRLLGDKSIWELPATQGLLALLSIANGQLWQETSEIRVQQLTAFWQLPPMGMNRQQRERLIHLSASQPTQVLAAIESLPDTRSWLKKHWSDRGALWHQLIAGDFASMPARSLINQYLADSDAFSRIEKLSATAEQAEIQQGVIWALLAVIPVDMSISDALQLFAQMKQDSLRGQAQAEAVSLTTIHRVKGREWDAVFVAGLKEGAFPSQKSVDDVELLYEERRLFYVAVTRARRALYLCLPDAESLSSLWCQGLTAETAGKNCRFLAQSNVHVCQQLGDYLHGLSDTLPSAVDVRIANAYLQAQGRSEQLQPTALTKKASGALQQAKQEKGVEIHHDKFGLGVILAVNGDKIEVGFADGVRWLKADHPALSWS